MKRPNSMRHLDDAIRRMCDSLPESYIHARTMMANAIVAHLLPDGVIKGGSALKMRFGNEKSRFTTDLDTATAMDPTLYIEKLDHALKAGWEGFSGRVVARDPASPDGVLAEYVMKPYDVKLSYAGKPWCTIPLEVAHNEIGDADVAIKSRKSSMRLPMEETERVILSTCSSLCITVRLTCQLSGIPACVYSYTEKRRSGLPQSLSKQVGTAFIRSSRPVCLFFKVWRRQSIGRTRLSSG